MRRSILNAFLITSSVLFFSCAKDKPPSLEFDNNGNYIYYDCTRSVGDSITVHVMMHSGNGNGLTQFKIDRVYDSGSNVEVFNTTYGGVQSANKVYTIHLRNQQGTEKYIFTVTDSAGLTGQKVLTIQTI
ncbi:MAG TPA: hypothetical protein VL651_12650 [Bacteroidia bacterium]|jgi:hypothetical protein|nr:hypothetical protein [Bacteroidia bacterium]